MERIDVSKLLKECPPGMELDSTMYENIVFDKIIEDDKNFPIRVIRSEDGLRMSLTKYGQYSDIDSAKCIIFPKGKTTWKDFHRPFKDGDIIYVCDEYSDATLTYVAILKQLEKGGEIISHCFYNYEEDYFSINDFLYDGYNTRFATEKEKEELFKVIKDNGYEWNPETKILEKFIESKEDTEDKIVMSGIYFDKENYADEVELHLGNYEIEIRDGKTYAVFKNQETKNSKPKFKVGDKIKHKNTVLTIINVKTNSYIVEDEPDNFGILMFSQQDKWELVNEPRFKVGDRVKSIYNGFQYDIKELTDTHYTLVEVKDKFKYTEPIIEDKNWELVNKPKFKVGDKIKNKSLDIFNPLEITAVSPRIYTFTNGSFHYVETIDKDYELVSRKFDISTLKPFDKVLVRDTKEQVWVADLFSHMINKPFGGYTFACVGHYPSQCIPYEGNEHLLGTTNDCDEYFNLIS